MITREAALDALMEGTLGNAEADFLQTELSRDPSFVREYEAALKVCGSEATLKDERSVPSSDFTNRIMCAVNESGIVLAPQSQPFKEWIESWLDCLSAGVGLRAVQSAVAASILLATSSVSFWAGTRHSPLVLQLPVTEVFIPREDIHPGTTLTAGLFEKRLAPVAAIPQQAVRNIDELTGQVAAHLIVSGYALDRHYMKSDPNSLPPGYRFVGIPLDEAGAGLQPLRPGDDIQLVAALKNAGGDLFAAKLTHRARIARLDVEGDSGRVIAYVIVPTADAARIDLAKREGDVLIMSNSNNFPT